jgi:hypothetical protein
MWAALVSNFTANNVFLLTLLLLLLLLVLPTFTSSRLPAILPTPQFSITSMLPHCSSVSC